MNCEVWSVLGTSFSGIHFENGVIRQLWLFPFYNRDHRFKKVEWQLQDDFLTFSVILEYLLLDTEASSLLGKSKYWHTTGFSFKDVTWRNHWAFLVAVVQSLSQAQLFATPWTAAQKASLSFNICWSLLNSCSLSRWCLPTISSSVIPFSSCLQSFPASASFLMSQFFTPGAKGLQLQLQHQSFQWIFRVDFL